MMRGLTIVLAGLLLVQSSWAQTQSDTSGAETQPSYQILEEPVESSTIQLEDGPLAPISLNPPGGILQDQGEYRSEGPMGTRDIHNAVGGRRREGRRCWVQGRYVRHGWRGPISQINPCFKKLCHDGALIDWGDGCYYKNECYPINRTFFYKCKPLRCTKSTHGGVHSYNVNTDRTQRPRCQDAYRRCRAIGEQNFRAEVQGRIYDNCLCNRDGYTLCLRPGPRQN